MGWTTEGLKVESRWRQEFSLLHVVQTSSEVHPTSYTMGTGGSFRGLSDRRVKLSIDLRLVLRSRKRGSIYPLPYVFMA
jgi:hypothetical protein